MVNLVPKLKENYSGGVKLQGTFNQENFQTLETYPHFEIFTL